MSKFEFRSNKVELDIAGHKFSVNCTNDLIEKTIAFGERAIKKGNEIKNYKDYNLAIKETCQFCYDAIDELIEPGASKKIFEGREDNVYDCIDVINYITHEYQKTSNITNQKYSPNRAQRRAQNKKR